MAGGYAERLAVVTLAERPDLRAAVFGPAIQAAVPQFMRHDPTAALYYGASCIERYRDFMLAAFDPEEPHAPVARACAVPFAFRDGTPGRGTLPDAGWDAVIRWGDEDQRAARRPTAVGALEIMVAPRVQGRGVSHRMLAAMRDNARRLGFRGLYAPIRPTEKDREPRTPFAEYVARRRGDGQPHDAWLRTHLRAGAEIVKIAPCSMTIPGTLADWREWTALAFDRDGEAIVPGALAPVHVSLAQDHAVYVEPNLWLHHRL
ncbi:MAG TPA: hypothetical protein VFA12_18640 [Stellaceae bacterium]|nr:hypothetical protein [Stellaceae bacterium]